MRVVNVELCSLIFLVTLFISYIYNFKHRFTKTSYQFITAFIFIGILSLLNISLVVLPLNSYFRYIILILSFYFVFLLPYVFYEYVEENILLSKYYVKFKKYIRIIYLVYIPICILLMFLKATTILVLPFSINTFTYYNILLLFSLLPMLVLFLEYTYYLFFKKESKNIKIFLITLISIIGIFIEIGLTNYYLLTPLYIIICFILYNYKYELITSKDVLTGLHNREIIKKIETNRRHTNKELVVYMIDVNKFKSINDTYGHDKGDMVLKKVAKILLDSVRNTDYVIRYGGDEFIIIAFFDDAKDAPVIPKKVQNNVTKYNKFKKIKISLSIGYEILKLDKNGKYNIYKSLEKADKKMYAEKRKRS
ncbi:MAG TPA: GGDEF domain-containing protein [Bacilli bacterium]|nr:GGDEF domain-containing protein [Bacilli bacterium]